jgi:EmrB/QacA subfamily drug resistance transporter
MSHIITDPFRQKLLLGAVSLGVVMDGVDGAIVNVALPTMAEYFDTDTGTIAWVIITYLLMMAGLMLVFGKFADRGLAKKIFLAGFGVFTAASLACGLAPTLEILLAARLVQGAGAAMIAAVAPLLFVRHLPAGMLAMALGVLATTSSIGFAVGPAIGGFLTQYFSWHWIFLINLPIGIAGILFAARVIPEDEPEERPAPFDYPGAVLLFMAMALVTIVLEEGLERGISDPLITGCITLGIISAALFILRELTVKSPLINIRIFLSGAFSAVLVAYMLMNIVFMGIIYLLPFYLTTMMGYDPAVTGLFLLVPPAAIALLSIPFGKWSDRYGRRVFAVAATGVIIVYSVLFAFLVPESGILPLLAGLILIGVSVGIFSGPAASRVIESAPEGEEGTGSSLMVTTIYFGAVLGTAIYAAIFTIATMQSGAIVPFADLDEATFLSGFHLTIAAGIALGALALVLSAVVPDRKKV